MSSYHILDSPDRESSRVIFHIAVPTNTNTVGIIYPTALKEYLLSENSTITSKVPWLSVDFPTETSAIQNGTIFEYDEIVNYDANITNGARRTLIDNRYNVLVTTIPNKIQIKLGYWKFNRNVV